MKSDLNIPPESINNLHESVEKIIKNIDTLAFWLASKVDDLFPGDIFWIDKYEHCKELESLTEDIGDSMNLNQEETLLLSVIFKGHDIWRHQEVLNKLDTLRSGVRHGILWVNILTEANALEWLSENQKISVLSAIQYHSEKTVELNSQSLWYKLCYILRDFDKKEIIDDQKYLEVAGIFEQINKHYFRWELADNHKMIISDLLLWNGLKINSDDRNSIKLESVMTNWINPLSLDEFFKQEATTVQDIKYSYSTYMLNTISLMFDIENNVVLIWFIQSEMFKRRLDFIQQRVTPDIFEKIIETISIYLKNKLWNEEIKNNIKSYNSEILNLIK